MKNIKREWHVGEYSATEFETASEFLNAALSSLTSENYTILNIMLDVSSGYQNFVVIAFRDIEVTGQ